MTELFDIEPTVPKWRDLVNLHGIMTSQFQDETWMATTGHGYDETETGETEKEAVVSLIHRLRLTGWETVSL